MDQIIDVIIKNISNKKIILLGDVHGNKRVFDILRKAFFKILSTIDIKSCSFELSVDYDDVIKKFIETGKRDHWNMISTYKKSSMKTLEEDWFLFWNDLRKNVINRNIFVSCVDVGKDDFSRVWSISKEELQKLQPLETAKYANNSERCKIIAERILNLPTPLIHIGGPGHLERKAQYIQSIEQNVLYDRYWLEQSVSPDDIVSFVGVVNSEMGNETIIKEREKGIFDIIV